MKTCTKKIKLELNNLKNMIQSSGAIGSEWNEFMNENKCINDI